MKLLKNILFTFSFLFVASIVYAGRTYAAIDISLEDNKTDKTISVIVNSNGSYLPAIAFDVKFSNDVNIVSSVNTQDYCKFYSTNEIMDERVNVLCFNNSDTVVNGAVAVISYEATNSGYSFYIDEKTLDVGSLPLGEVKDINKPQEIATPEITDATTVTTDTSAQSTSKEETTISKITSFLAKNKLYVLAGSITLIAIIIAIIGFTPKKEENN